MILERCTTVCSHPTIVKSENGRKISILNKAKLPVSIVQIDGCQIMDGERCDLLFLTEKNAYFIELKGSDLSHAFTQLERSINKLKPEFEGQKISSFVVCSKVKPALTTRIQKAKVYFKKRLNSNLKVKCDKLEENID